MRRLCGIGSRGRGGIGLGGLALALLVANGAQADVPFPTCAAAGCSDAADFGSYLFIAPGAFPNDYNPNGGEAWKFAPETGMDIEGAWERTTGRPDVAGAILDSGIIWDRRDVTRTVLLNADELPVSSGCTSQDCDGNGFVSIDDFADACTADLNGNGFCDGQDLILFYADGVDDDGNGFVDDIAGWDFLENDNDPDDDVDYGHGSGEAGDQYAEANNGGGTPGFAPSSFFLPLRVGDSFVADDGSFLQAVVYAVDRHVDLISEALGSINASDSGQAAVGYAYRRGIPIIASAADEESRHHNAPANYDHMIWVNSVKNGDGLVIDKEANGFELLNGCTNYGGKAWVAIPSSSCSSEATGRAGGLTALLISHAKNQIDRGLFTPYPGTGTPFSAEEVRQLLRASARDVDQSAAPFLEPTANGNLLAVLLSAPARGLYFGSSQYPTQAEWDQFTGYGRPNAPTLFDLVTDTTIPPEVDLSGSVRWFDIIDPVRTPSFDVRGSARALRAGNNFDWTLEVGCGIQPQDYVQIGSGSGDGAAIDDEVLVGWASGETATSCGFDPTQPIDGPDVDAHTVTLRLRVRDTFGNLGEDRRTVAIHSDPTLRFAPIHLPGSGESSPALVDVNRDGVLDIVQSGGDGAVHALDGATGNELPGFPAHTNALPVHASPAFSSGDVSLPHEAVIGAAAADDIDGDGRAEIVVASILGRLYVFDDHGQIRAGFPVATDPNLSLPVNRNRLNDMLRGFASAPVLANLDAAGQNTALEIVASALDGNLYAWRANGAPVTGFPVRLADRAKVSIDPATGKATPLAGVDARERAAKSLSSPAIGDLDGDGRPEIVVATNEEYGNELNGFAIESRLFRSLAGLLGSADIDEFSVDTQGRVYAVKPDGNAAADGPFVAGWPVKVPLLTPGVLPTVGTGTPGSPAITDIDGNGSVRVAIFGMIGPVMLLKPDGTASLGSINGAPRALAIDFPGGFPTIPATAGSPDAPFFAALGAGAFGDITGDGLPEYVAPTGGLRKLFDIVAPAQQGQLPDADSFVEDGVFAHHQITAWNPRTGALVPAFPRVMEDMQFIGSPALADVDGDGVAEAINGSGAYLVRAYRADGSEPAGWPKFTHGWHLSSATPGDVDGDGNVEIVATTREGNLFVWDTPAAATEAALPWAGYGRDRRNTKNGMSGVSNLAAAADPLAGLGWALETIRTDLTTLASVLQPPESTLLAGSPAPFLIPRALGHIGRSNELKTSKTLRGIEWGLRLPPEPIAALEPLHARFTDAVRATLEREIAATHCAATDTACKRKLMKAEFCLWLGDNVIDTDPSDGIRYWSLGIAVF